MRMWTGCYRLLYKMLQYQIWKLWLTPSRDRNDCKKIANVTVSSSRLHGDLLDRLNRTRIESEDIGLVLLGEREVHVGIYHSSQSRQHFVYAVHCSFVLALETHYCRSLRTSFLYYFDTE